MRIQGLINRLQKIKEKYGNVEVLTLKRGELSPPKAEWLIDGARFSLERFSNELGEQKRIVL